MIYKNKISHRQGSTLFKFFYLVFTFLLIIQLFFIVLSDHAFSANVDNIVAFENNEILVETKDQQALLRKEQLEKEREQKAVVKRVRAALRRKKAEARKVQLKKEREQKAAEKKAHYIREAEQKPQRKKLKQNKA